MSAAPLRRWFSLTLFFGLVVGLVGVSVPATAATVRTISAVARPAAVPTSGTTTFTGVLSKSPQGSAVQVQRKSGTKWVLVRSGVTKDAAGRYSVAIRVPKTAAVYAFRVFAPSKGGLRSAASKTVNVYVLKRVTATIRKSASRVYAGQTVTFRGTVAPFVRNTAVIVQRKVGSGAWHRYTTATINSRGAWSKAVKPPTTAAYRAYVPRRGNHAPAYSGFTTVAVIPPPRITTTSMPAAAQGFPYSPFTLSKVGGAGTWSLSKGFLPFGMSLNASTGVISGTPTAIETANFTVRFVEKSSALTDTQALSIKVVPAVPPRITTTSLSGATKGTPYGAQLSKTGNAGTWSVTGAKPLPPGITLNPTTGALSGTPTKGGSYAFTARFVETTTGLDDTQDLTIVVTANPPTITTTTLADAKKGAPYAATQLQKTGGSGTWSVASGTLPTGITLSAAGVLSGTPASSVTPGDFTFTVRFTESDADGLSDTQSLTLKVNDVDAPVITTGTLPGGTVGDEYGPADLEATPNVGEWSITTGSLPNGLTLNPTSGVIDGTPTVAGDFGFTVRFAAQAGGSVTKPFSIHIDPDAPVGPTITTTSIPAAKRGEGYSTQLQKTGGAGTWSLQGGTLPTGVTLNGTTGVISGTPSQDGSFPITVRFTETTGGLFDDQPLTLTVAEANPPVITTTTVPNGQQYAPYSTTLVKTAGIPGATGSWAVTAGALPAGLALNAGTGLLSGTPTASGVFDFTVTYTETATGLSDTQGLSLTVAAATPPSVTSTTLPNGLKGVAYSTTLSKTAGTPAGQPGTWSISAGTLSGSGLTLNPTTGAITGTPGVRGDWFFTARYTETTSGLFGEKALTIHVSNDTKAVITTSSLANGEVGETYSQDVNGTGQSGTTEGWEVASGQLPDGLTLNPVTGEITGTPTEAGNFTVKLRMTRYVLIVVRQTDDERTFNFVIAP